MLNSDSSGLNDCNPGVLDGKGEIDEKYDSSDDTDDSQSHSHCITTSSGVSVKGQGQHASGNE